VIGSVRRVSYTHIQIAFIVDGTILQSHGSNDCTSSDDPSLSRAQYGPVQWKERTGPSSRLPVLHWTIPDRTSPRQLAIST
jgi:hypothetical protein